METDRLHWWEDIPLALALVAQSYVVGLWYYASIHGASDWVDLAVAVGAGLALDLIVVTTVMGRRAGRSSGWSWATSLGAFVCSSLIALDRYGWEWRSGLHVAFPLVVFLYSQHLATPRKRSDVALQASTQIALEALPERSRSTEAVESGTDAADPWATQDQALLSEWLPPPLETSNAPLAANGTSTYECPHCQAPLKSKQARGAAVANGYCPACKAERLVARRN
jgi:hypothetical protein